MGFQQLFRCLEEVKSFSTEFDCSMKVLGLLVEQLTDDSSESVDLPSSKKVDYQRLIFCSLCREGGHISQVQEEVVSDLKEDATQHANSAPNTNPQNGTLRFKCVHGKKVLTMRNSLRNSLHANAKGMEPSSKISAKPGVENAPKKATKHVEVPKYNRNLFRSNESLEGLREDGLDSKEASKGKGKTGSENEVAKILFQMKQTEKGVRRTSLDSNMLEWSRPGKNQEAQSEGVRRRGGFNRKTVSERKIPRIERTKTFEMGESIGSRTNPSENGQETKDAKLNMKMEVGDWKGRKRGDGQGGRAKWREEPSEEDLLNDSEDWDEGLRRISFSEKFLKSNVGNVFGEKNEQKQRDHMKKAIQKISLDLKRLEKRDSKEKTPRFQLPKEIKENKAKPGKGEPEPVKTFGKNANQFKFKADSKYSPRGSYGFCSLTEEQTAKEASREGESEGRDQEDFIEKGTDRGGAALRMRTISECTQESLSKQLLRQLKTTERSADKLNGESKPANWGTDDKLKSRSDFSGNLIRNSASIERVMKKSVRLDESERKGPGGGESVFGELKEPGPVESGSLDARHLPEKTLFSKKKEAEMGVISSQEETVGLSLGERGCTAGARQFGRFASERVKYDKGIGCGLSEGVSSRDFLLEKMLNSNEKLTKSALEKMLEQGQNSALMLKECFKDLLFKDAGQRPSQAETPKEEHQTGSEWERKYRRKKAEWKKREAELQSQSRDQGESIVRLETLLQSKERMMSGREEAIREAKAREADLMRERWEQAERDRSKMEDHKDAQIRDWRKQLEDAERKNERLREKLLVLEIRNSQLKFSQARHESAHADKSLQEVFYSKSTIPKSADKHYWGTRSQLDEHEVANRARQTENYLTEIGSGTLVKKRSKSLFNLATDRRVKARNWNPKKSEQEKTANDAREGIKHFSSARSMSRDGSRRESVRSLGRPGTSERTKSKFERVDLNRQRKLSKLSKLMQIEDCLSELRAKAKKKRGGTSLSALENVTDLDETANFQTFQDSNKVITSPNLFQASSKEIEAREEMARVLTAPGPGLGPDIDYTKNVFLNSGLVAEAKELEQELVKEKIILLQELKTETRKRKEEQTQSAEQRQLSSDLLKFLYCQALCIDTGLDTFEEFMEEDQPESYDKFLAPSMQAVKEVEEELEMDTSPREPRNDFEARSRAAGRPPTPRLGSETRDMLLTEKVETEDPESLNGLLSHGNERPTVESEVIGKSPPGFDKFFTKNFSHSQPNNELPSLLSTNTVRPTSNTLSGKINNCRSNPDFEYKVQLDKLRGEPLGRGHESGGDHFSERDIDKESLELTLQQVNRASRESSKRSLRGPREIGRGLMEEYISGENRRYFIKNGIKMRVDEQGIIIKHEPLGKTASENGRQAWHRNNLYNQTHSDHSPDQSIMGPKGEPKRRKSGQGKADWTCESNSAEDELEITDEMGPNQDEFEVEDEGNIYIHRHKRKLKERKQIDDSWGSPLAETKDLTQAVTPGNFDPRSENVSSCDADSDEELNIYELSSKHVRSSFESFQESIQQEGATSLASQNVSSKDFNELGNNSFQTLKKKNSFSKKIFKKQRKGVKLNRSKDEFLEKMHEGVDTKNMFYTLKERSPRSGPSLEKNET